MLGKLAVAVNTGGHLLQILTKRSIGDSGILCPLWLVINQFGLVSDTSYTCDTTVGCELY